MLRGCVVLIYDQIQNIYGLIEFINRILYTDGFKTLFYTFFYVKEKIKMNSYLTLIIKISWMYLHSRSLRVHIGIQIFTNIKVFNQFKVCI